MDQACGMGIELIKTIGCTRHYLKHRDKWDKSGTYIRNSNGLYIDTNVNDDDKLATLSDRKGYGSANYGSTTKTSTSVTMDEQLKFESVKYIVNRYESYINSLKTDVLESVKKICETSNIDFALFEETIKDKFNTDITF